MDGLFCNTVSTWNLVNLYIWYGTQIGFSISFGFFFFYLGNSIHIQSLHLVLFYFIYLFRKMYRTNRHRLTLWVRKWVSFWRPYLINVYHGANGISCSFFIRSEVFDNARLLAIIQSYLFVCTFFQFNEIFSRNNSVTTTTLSLISIYIPS